MVSIPHPLKGRSAPLRVPRPAGSSGAWVAAGIVLLGASALLPVLEKSTVTSRGFTLQDHEAAEVRLATEIRRLEAEVARLTSLERVERRAAQLGLRPADLPIYVEVDEPGPDPAKIPAELLPPPEPVPQDPLPWWRSLLGWVSTPW